MKSYYCGLILAVLLGAAAGRGMAADDKDKAVEKVLFEEKFGDHLGDGWSWVREDAKAWKLDKGALLIRTSTGGLWMKDNNTRNLLLRTPPDVKDGGIAVETVVENEPTNAFEHAGLVLRRR